MTLSFHLWQGRAFAENSDPWTADGTEFVSSCVFIRTNSFTIHMEISLPFTLRSFTKGNKCICCSFVCAIAFVWLKSRNIAFASPLCSLYAIILVSLEPLSTSFPVKPERLAAREKDPLQIAKSKLRGSKNTRKKRFWSLKHAYSCLLRHKQANWAKLFFTS